MSIWRFEEPPWVWVVAAPAMFSELDFLVDDRSWIFALLFACTYYYATETEIFLMEVVWLSDYFIVPPYGAPPAARLID